MAEGASVTSSGATRPPRSRIPVRLLLFGAVAVAAFELGFLAFGVERSRILVRQFGYFTIAGTFAWAVFALVRLRSAMRDACHAVPRREWWQAGGVVVACFAVVLLTMPVNYKILYDEMVLQATASDMHIYREVSTVVRAYLVDGLFAPFDTYLDKRPFFYPFLVSVLHDLTGYREGNAFALNVVLYPLILLQVYLFARRLGRHVGGIAAVLALGTLSALAQSATSAGMETLNLAMIITTMQLALLYLDRPDEPRLAALLLSAVLLAQTRYESSLYVLPVAIVALTGWRRAGRVIMPVAAILAPALLIPYAVHNTYLSGTPSLWELRENERTRFSTEHLGPNLDHAFNYFLNLRGGLTNSFWLSIAGAAALLYGLGFFWRHRREGVSTLRPSPDPTPLARSSAFLVVLTFSLAVFGNLAVLMFYYWGQLDDPTVSRLSLPVSLIFALAIGFAVDRLGAGSAPADVSTVPPASPWMRVRARWQRNLPWIAAGGAVLAYLWSGVIANEQHNRRNTLADELAWETRFVQARPPGERLVISNKSALPWMLNHISSISIERARRHVDQLRYQLAHDNFRELLVTQQYRPTTAVGDFQLDPLDRLPDWFVLETVAEKRFGAHLDRISRLVAIQPNEPTAGASK